MNYMDLLDGDAPGRSRWPVMMMRPVATLPLDAVEIQREVWESEADAAVAEKRLDALHREASDPLVWCGCYRGRIRLSVANRGGTCTDCRRRMSRNMD
jgi:hypothetical protein